ncbi:MAG: flagellar motor switch protein FliG [Woeseiaceae bacterium]|nr:flagellar motor switch protein FliG [Woeseiaceae bacterium]
MSEQETVLTGTQRAAMLLLSLGEKEAAEVLKYMEAEDVQAVGTAMATLKEVSKDTASSVLDGFITDFEGQTALGVASQEYVRKVLTHAFNETKASLLMDRMIVGDDAKGIDALKWMSSREIVDIIDGEHPQIVAIIVSFLRPELAADVIDEIPEDLRSDVVMRIANLTDVQQSALAEIEALIANKSEDSSKTAPKKVGGAKVAAAIVNALAGPRADEILGAIKAQDADLSERIEEMMFVFDTLLGVDDRGIQVLLREISNDLLVVALKGAAPEMQEKILGNMSKRAAALLKDDMEAKGPTKLSEVEQAQREILDVARRLADAGDLDLGGGGEEYV